MSTHRRQTATDRLCRLIQIALALYLLPVLLVVSMMTVLGMLIVGCARWLIGPDEGLSSSQRPASWPHAADVSGSRA